MYRHKPELPFILVYVNESRLVLPEIGNGLPPSFCSVIPDSFQGISCQGIVNVGAIGGQAGIVRVQVHNTRLKKIVEYLPPEVSLVFGAYFLLYFLATKFIIPLLTVTLCLLELLQLSVSPMPHKASKVHADISFCCAVGNPSDFRMSCASLSLSKLHHTTALSEIFDKFFVKQSSTNSMGRPAMLWRPNSRIVS